MSIATKGKLLSCSFAAFWHDNAANVYCCMCRKSLVLYVFSRDLGGYTTILSIKSQITKWHGKESVQLYYL
ncbi:hypothetical protein P029_03110 [Anaplasma phagocytophilum str. Norway variant2]|uniref:Uncharacterized protein n=1 Tax=Anaplasma phagocytophilum str. Norway variant2 TaxID=1392507 RepID=A0A161IK25_ANAPH|nr:hypothetical protein P029_03110 [Anaplasma phagocytophilum str. Norway variant2]